SSGGRAPLGESLSERGLLPRVHRAPKRGPEAPTLASAGFLRGLVLPCHRAGARPRRGLVRDPSFRAAASCVARAFVPRPRAWPELSCRGLVRAPSFRAAAIPVAVPEGATRARPCRPELNARDPVRLPALVQGPRDGVILRQSEEPEE